MTPQAKLDLIDQVQRQLGRPMNGFSLKELENSYRAILFQDVPASGDQVPYPQGTVLVFTPDEDVIDVGKRDTMTVYFY